MTTITDANIHDLVKTYLRNPQELPVYLRNISISNWDVSRVTDMSQLFANAEDFNEPLNKWNVREVRSMREMFYKARKFNQPLNNWKVGNVKNMYAMFSHASNFNQPLNKWDVSNVIDMSDMFSHASKFNQPLNNWNVSKVRNMNSMFEDAREFNRPLNNWNLTTDFTSIDYMFDGAVKFQNKGHPHRLIGLPPHHKSPEVTKKAKTQKKCADGKERNPKTGRCVNVKKNKTQKEKKDKK